MDTSTPDRMIMLGLRTEGTKSILQVMVEAEDGFKWVDQLNAYGAPVTFENAQQAAEFVDMVNAVLKIDV